MGIADRLKDLTKKAEETAAEHKDQIHKAVQKAEDVADKRTEGKYHDKIVQAGRKADAYVDNLKAPGNPDVEGGAAPPKDAPV